jgi:type III restriction enzyme
MPRRQQNRANNSVTKVMLDKIVNNLLLPANANYDFINFANNMQLFDYQQNAVVNATKLLCRYFDKTQALYANKYLEEQYRNNNIDYSFDQLSVNKQDTLYNLLANYYIEDNNTLHYSQFLNRMNFWMATGSGKTIVMIKLISIMAQLMQDDLITTKPIMLLAPDDKILEQIKNVTAKYNLTTSSNKIDLVDLKENWEQDNIYGAEGRLFAKSNIRVYYYKSNNFVDDKSDVAVGDGKNIYFDNYRNNNGWYLFLDEAHRGDDNTSKHKAIFNILAQNGFMFNFSATFTDDIDRITTIFDMNLSKFLKEGYGKKLYISNTEIGDLATIPDERVVFDRQDLDKQKTIAKTILLLALQRKNATLIKQIDAQLYHAPLMLILAGKVNSEDKGLKPFFQYLINMVKNEWNIDDAKEELQAEIKLTTNGIYDNFKFGLGDDTQVKIMCNQINNITTNDIWQYVFGGSKGTIEVITFENNKDEVAFKLKTANQPFALLVIAEAISWLRTDTSGVFELVNRSIDKSLYNNINSANNIAMLLGSQMFKEGWDSNRPNIVCYLGIGKNADNKKYVMQTIGRGIRIEPLPNQRKRFEYCNTDSLTAEQITKIRQLAPILETEFVFATDSNAVNQIWKEIQESSSKENWNKLHKWFTVNHTIPNKQLLIPKYKDDDTLQDKPFRTNEYNKERIVDYLKLHQSDKVLALKHERINLRTINKLRHYTDTISISNNNNIPSYKPHHIITAIHKHFNEKPKLIDSFVYLTNQIKHYQYIATTLTDGDLKKLEDELKQIMHDDSKIVSEEKLLEQLNNQQITIAEYTKQLFITKQHQNNQIEYKFINDVTGIKQLFKHHYYQPLLYIKNEQDRSNFQHIIKVESEIKFLIELCGYQQHLNDKYQWWYFTKIDETLDKDIGIEYFDSEDSKSRNFYPDFIFWLKNKQDGNLTIKFIDPKGLEQGQKLAYDKYKGFQELFNPNRLSTIKNAPQVDLYFYNKDSQATRSLTDEYKKTWVNNVDQIFNN